jgi:actin-like ATPase involved in cell morphogenesis
VSYSLGIDLGTTFTAAAVLIDGRTEVVSLGNHAATIPSVVFLRDDGDVIVGDVAHRRGQQEPDRFAREFKRRFGDSTPIMLGHTPYSAERLMAAVLQQVAGQVAERYGGPPDSVAIAHPANWGPYKIELLGQAVQLAGLAGARFVTEPEAAAVHFAAGERLEDGDLVAVYDLGGGTFDAAVLRRVAGGFETLGEPQGIERLGGIDFDEAVLSHVRSTVGDALAQLDPADQASRAAIMRLREECVAAKEALSGDSETSIPVMLPGLQTQVRLTRAELEDAIRPALRETVESLRRAIDAAGVTPADIKAIVLAGGSSRIPLVNELVSELGRPVVLDAHPKHTVALGASLLAADGGGPPVAPVPVPVAGGGHGDADLSSGGGGGDGSNEGKDGTEGADPGRGRLLLAIVAIVAMVAVVVIAVVLLGGDPDETSDSTTSTVDTSGGTTSTTAGPTCESSSGRCVFIDDVTTDSDGLVIAYSTVGFEPLVSGEPADHHIHFYYDTIPPEEAGGPIGTGDWLLWDVDDDGAMLAHGDPFIAFDAIPDEATQICGVVATFDHQLDEDPRPVCADLP